MNEIKVLGIFTHWNNELGIAKVKVNGSYFACNLDSSFEITRESNLQQGLYSTNMLRGLTQLENISPIDEYVCHKKDETISEYQQVDAKQLIQFLANHLLVIPKPPIAHSSLTYLYYSAERKHLVSTDGHILHISPFTLITDKSFCISRQNVELLLSSLKLLKLSKVSVAVKKEHLRVISKDYEINIGFDDSIRYPNYAKVVPDCNDEHSCFAINACKFQSILAKIKSIKKELGAITQGNPLPIRFKDMNGTFNKNPFNFSEVDMINNDLEFAISYRLLEIAHKQVGLVSGKLYKNSFVTFANNNCLTIIMLVNVRE